MSKFTDYVTKVKEGWAKVSPVFQKIGDVVGAVCHWVYKLRKIFMAAPVLWAAIQLALDNASRLPEAVGLNLQATGEYAVTVTRNYAVWGPLGVTVFCLLLMFCSRKATYPWIVSIFTLALPWLIYLTNIYPG